MPTRDEHQWPRWHPRWSVMTSRATGGLREHHTSPLLGPLPGAPAESPVSTTEGHLTLGVWRSTDLRASPGGESRLTP